MENNEITKILERLGLRRQEIAIYMVLLEHGPMQISDICTETNLYRPMVYKYLPKLVERQIVTVMKRGKRKVYSIESPEKLLSVVKMLENSVQLAIPEMRAMFESSQNRPIIHFYEGKEGIIYVYEDVIRTLKKGDMFYRYASGSAEKKSLRSTYMPKNYRKIRDEKQLERFVITNRANAGTKQKRMERAMKIVPEKYGLFDYDITQIVYANKMALIDYNTETAIVIENEVLAKFQAKIFKIIFDLLPAE